MWHAACAQTNTDLIFHLPGGPLQQYFILFQIIEKITSSPPASCHLKPVGPSKKKKILALVPVVLIVVLSVHNVHKHTNVIPNPDRYTREHKCSAESIGITLHGQSVSMIETSSTTHFLIFVEISHTTSLRSFIKHSVYSHFLLHRLHISHSQYHTRTIES